MLDDERILDLAETQDIDVADLASDVAQRMEEDDAFNSKYIDVDPQMTIADAVRVDVFAILARKFGPILTIKQFLEAVRDASIQEQLVLIADRERRIECVRAVFRDLADDALTVVLTEQGMFDGLNTEDPDDYRKIIESIKKYRTLLGMKLCIV